MTPIPRDDHGIEEMLSTPLPGAIETVRQLDGDYMVLGVGGKMGTSLAVMLRRALDAAGKKSAVVYGVSRFSRASAREELEAFGVKTLPCDFTRREQVAALPEVANVQYLSGQKFGTDSAPGETWIQNVVVPALIAPKFRASRIVVFSTGCVYPFAAIDGPGANETTPVDFIGEYASTCVGRERIFSHMAQAFGTRQLLFRLNYSVELRYGVLVDIADKVRRGEPVDVTMAGFNLIWQGDAVARAIQCLAHAANPPKILNVTGPKVRIRDVAEEFGKLFGRAPVLTGREAGSAWIADPSESNKLFGPLSVSLPHMMTMIAEYLSAGGRLLGKPTHFETRDGKF
jgi:nucleoside-diphosphate-sugar epimerase